MAKLTDLSTAERPAPRVGGTPQMQTSGRADDTLARGIASMSRDVAEGLEEVYRASKVEEERVNTLRAEEAFTKLRDKQLDLSIGQQNGFTTLKGSAAVGRPVLQEWGKRFEDVEREIESTLSNDQQRLKFKQRSQVARLQFNEDILRHLGREGDTYAKEVYDGTIATEQRNAVARWDSPNDIAAALVRIRSTVEERAERYGWPAEYRGAVLREQSGKVHAAVVQQAIAQGNFRYAQAWYEENKADIDLGTAKQLQHAVAEGTQKQLAAGYNAEYLSIENNPEALQSLHGKVLADKDLDESRRNVIVGRVQHRISVLEHKAELANERRLRLVQSGINELNGNTLAGFEPSAEQFAPVISAARGTELEPQVNQAIQLANATRNFRAQPPVVQERMLAEAEAGVREQPGKFDRRVVAAWRTIYDAQRQQVREDPISFALRQGIVEQLHPLDLTQPNLQEGALAHRFAIARGMATRYQASMKPLTGEETKLLTAMLSSATVEQKRTYFAGIAQASGGDAQGYMAIMAQIAPDDPVSAIAGSQAGRGLNANATLMLRGQAILRPPSNADGKPDGGLLPMPPEGDMRMRYDAYVREAFAGRAEARNAHYQAAKAAYAALSVDAGDRDTKVLDADRFERAMTIAIGPVEKYQGRRVVMPQGYEYSQFRDGLRERIDVVVEGGRLDESWTAARLRDLPLENVGDGRYVLRAGDAVVVDKQGKPVLIDFNLGLPFKTSGHGLAQREEPSAAELAAAARPVTGRALPRADRKPQVAGK